MFVMADNFVFQNPAQRKLAERYQQLPFFVDNIVVTLTDKLKLK